MKHIEVKIPRGFMNVEVTIDNHLTAENRADFDTLKFPLPPGHWRIDTIKQQNVTLVDWSWSSCR